MSFTEAKLTPDGAFQYLKRAYYGHDVNTDPRGSCMNRAYRDLCRTIKFKGDFTDKEKQAGREIVKKYIRQRLSVLESDFYKAYDERDPFDKWHIETCFGIAEQFKEYADLTGGQTQKWLNMTLKYLLTIDDPVAKASLLWLHVPIDSIVIKLAKVFGIKENPNGWSNWSYDKYMKCQQQIMEGIAKEKGLAYPPILWEFENW